MRRLVGLAVLVVLAAVFAASAWAAQVGTSIHGGGSASDETRFAIGISSGSGHFECLMPGVMTVQASVTGIDWSTGTAAEFHGVAAVNLAANTPFGPAGSMARGVAYTATVTAGGPGVGSVDLEILRMSFVGTLEHGQIRIS
jgi:hypothetical protein